MTNGTVPTGRLCDTGAEKNARLRRGSKLRTIDRGTIYDVSGQMRRYVHEIESGTHGEVTDVVVAIRSVKDGHVGIKTAYLGKSEPAVLHLMASVLARDILG